MKYIKLYEDYYTEEYDVVLYPGKFFIRVDSVLKHEILSVLNGTKEELKIPRDKYSSVAFTIYKEDENLVFETKEGAKSKIEIEDVLYTFS